MARGSPVRRRRSVWIAGGLLTGPLFGYLGTQWRIRRAAIAAAIMAGVFAIEPIVRGLSGRLFGPSWVWALEAIAGVVLVGSFVAVRRGDAAIRGSRAEGSDL